MSDKPTFETVGSCACGGSHCHTSDAAHNHFWQLTEKQIIITSSILFAFALLAEDTMRAWGGDYAVYALFAAPYLLAGWGVFVSAFALIAKKDVLNEFTLMAGATLAAVALGELPEAVGVMLFYRIGEYVQDRAASSSRKSIAGLLAAKPKTATVITASGTTITPVEQVAAGQHLFIRAGDLIPLDGLVLEGNSTADQSPLTGESMPVALAPGSTVYGGTVNLSGTITVQATSAYSQSHMAQILEMVENALANKSPTERFITRFARYYTPAVFAIALLVAIIPPVFFAQEFSTWVYRALVMLVISCPCALLLSVPLGYFGGIGAASRRGILVKGGAVLDNLQKIHTVVFDKTGTLTHGQFTVASMATAQGVEEHTLLQAAATAEQYSTHPLAKAIVAYAKNTPAAQWQPHLAQGASTHEIPGKGISVTINNNTIVAGTASLMASIGITVNETNTIGAVVHTASNNQYLGAMYLADTIKPDTKEAIAALSSMGKSTYMLSGDKNAVAAFVAQEIGLQGYEAELLPEHKVEAFLRLGNPQQVAFVGDGINDAPVLATAGVAIAMGKLGSEAAVEAADAVIINDSPTKVGELFLIAQKVRNIVWQNIALALGIKSLFMVFGIVGISGLWEAVFADVGVAVLAVLNSTRAGNIK